MPRTNLFPVVDPPVNLEYVYAEGYRKLPRAAILKVPINGLNPRASIVYVERRYSAFSASPFFRFNEYVRFKELDIAVCQVAGLELRQWKSIPSLWKHIADRNDWVIYASPQARAYLKRPTNASIFIGLTRNPMPSGAKAQCRGYCTHGTHRHPKLPSSLAH